MDQLLYDIPTAASKIGLGRTAFYSLLDTPDGIATVRILRRRLVPHSSLESFVQKKIEEARQGEA